MSQAPAFDVKIPESHKIKFTQDITYENFMAQFQKFCPVLLCIINGTTLHYYNGDGDTPQSIRFDRKRRTPHVTEYYFKDMDNDNTYCVFGRENALVFYPHLEEADPSVSQASARQSSTRNVPPPPTPNTVVIIDKGQQYIFPNPNYDNIVTLVNL